MKHLWIKIVLIGLLIFCKITIADTRSSIALFNLTPISMDAIGADADLLFSLETELDKSQSISVMSRRDMEAILYRIGGAQVADTNKVMSYGLELGVNFVLTGEIDKTGSLVTVNIKLIDISNNRVSQTWQESYNGRGDILQRSKQLAKEIELTLIESALQSNSFTDEVTALDYILDLTASTSNSGIQISWNISTDISVLYTNVYRGSSQEGPFEFVSSIEETQFEDEVSGSYFYRLDLVLEDGREIKGTKTVSAQSSTNNIKVDISLSPPTIMSQSSLVNGIKIDFIPQLNNQGVLGYHFYQKQADSTWLKVHSINKDKTLNYSIVLDKNFIPNNAYSVSVTAFSEQGESKHSEVISFTTPSLIKLTTDNKQYLRATNLIWDKASLGTGYKIYRKKQTSNEWQVIQTLSDLTKTQYQDKVGLEDGQTYLYAISLIDKFTESPKSEQIHISTKPLSEAPNQFSAKGNLVKKVNITWQPIIDSDISGYAIYRHEGQLTDDTRLTEIAFVENYQSSNYTDGSIRPLKDGQNYHYAIAARNIFSTDGKLTETQSIITKPLPESPSNIALSASENAIKITWNPNPETDIKHYRIFRKWNNEPWQNIAKSTDTQFQDTNLKVYAKTFYKLTAIDLDGLESNSSPTHEILSPLKLNLKVKQQHLLRTIVLSWEPKKNITGYKLYSKDKNKTKWQLIKTLEEPTLATYRDVDKKRLKEGSEYEYKITAFDKFIETQFSNIVVGTTKALPLPPQEFKAKSGLVKSVQLSWLRSTDQDNKGYILYRKNFKGEFEEIEKISNLNKDNYLDDGDTFRDLTDGTQYEYKIVTFNKYSVSGAFSNVISATTKRIPETIKGLSIEKDTTGLMLFWQLSTNKDINQYHIFRSSNSSCSSMRKVTSVNSAEDVYLDSTIKPDTHYCYKVIAIDKDKLQSKLSLPVLYKTLPKIEGT